MSTDEPTVLVCVPADPPPDPVVPGSGHAVCCHCWRTVVAAPSGLAALAAGAVAVCLPCAGSATAAELEASARRAMSGRGD